MINKKLKISMQLIGITALGATLAGCISPWTQQRCQTTNWYQMGYGVGQQGQNQQNLQPAVTQCAKYNVTVDTGAYSRGWRAGTRVYCQPSNAFNLGVNGQTYNNVCPANMAAAFNQAWRRGLRRYCVPATGYNLGRSGKPMPSFCAPDQVVQFRNAYFSGQRKFQRQQTVTNELNDVNNQIADTNKKIQHARKNIRNWQKQLNSGLPQVQGPAKAQKRRELMGNIRDARANINNWEQSLNRLTMQRGQLQRQLTRVSGQ